MSKERIQKILDFTAWVAFSIIVLYLLLRILGLIHSPMTVDLIALLSGAYFVGRYAKKIDDVFEDLDSIKDDVRTLDKHCPLFKEKGTKSR